MFRILGAGHQPRTTRIEAAPADSGEQSCFFAASTPSQGNELWVSDGTAAGTHIVKDINPGKDGSAPTSLTRTALTRSERLEQEDDFTRPHNVGQALGDAEILASPVSELALDGVDKRPYPEFTVGKAFPTQPTRRSSRPCRRFGIGGDRHDAEEGPGHLSSEDLCVRNLAVGGGTLAEERADLRDHIITLGLPPAG
ncbi:MAG: hypothetical protein K8U57_04315 [Planctomycetes bacterium]|nr:hypothetical protein [Planctomycetota bacterium]